MIDIHSHILPGIDDGPALIEQSLEMCKLAAGDGIKTIIATPHYKPNRFLPPEAEEVYATADKLNKRVREIGLDLTILTAAEVRITRDTGSYLDREEYITVKGEGKYMLSEFSMGKLPSYWKSALTELLERGVTPIIAHPERNLYFAKNPEELKAFVRDGVLTQITASSLTGDADDIYGKASIKLLGEGLVHFIATDSHSPLIRPPVLSEAVEAASKIIGMDEALKLVISNPVAVISGEALAHPS